MATIKEINRAAKESAPAAICLSNRYTGDQYRRSSIGAIHSLYFSPGRDAASRNRAGQRWKNLQLTAATIANKKSSAYPEPTSPKVGCMGQVRCQQLHHDPQANPKPLKPGSSTDGMRNTLTKIKKAFSGKWARRKDGEKYEFVAQSGGGKENMGSLDIDPPLQITRDVVIQGCEGSNLWKRRSAGLSLKKLQIEKGGLGLTSETPLTV